MLSFSHRRYCSVVLAVAAALFGGCPGATTPKGVTQAPAKPRESLTILVVDDPALGRAIAREWRERKPGPALLAPLWIATLLVSTCALEEPDAHFSRYQMPTLPVFLIWAAVGARRLGVERLAQGVRGWLVGTAGLALVFFAAAFGDNCQDIERMQIRLGETLAEALPPDAVVAINDAGAIAYFSGRRTLDLVDQVEREFSTAPRRRSTASDAKA